MMAFDGSDVLAPSLEVDLRRAWLQWCVLLEAWDRQRVLAIWREFLDSRLAATDVRGGVIGVTA